jgi:hypothetical protein
MQCRFQDLVCVSREAEDMEDMDKLRKSVVEDVTVGVCGGGWEWQPSGQEAGGPVHMRALPCICLKLWG